MRAFLQFQEMWYPIPRGNLVRIGSATECEIRLPHDTLISRRHCSVSYLNEELTIVDLRSSNGTLVNGTLLNGQPVRLCDGDRIRLGNTDLIVALRKHTPPI